MDASDRRKRATEEAAEWWVRLQTEDMPRAGREQFVDWLRESAVHVAEMLRIAQVHGALEQFQRWTRIATDGSREDDVVVGFTDDTDSTRSSPSTHPIESNQSRKGLWMGALAATVCAVAISIGVLLPQLRGQIIETERGERREVTLSDGSVVQVDPETRLRVIFNEQARRLSLERGRAFFRVAKNPDLPFLVQADETIVRAVGTAFGVERQKTGVVVTVAEGKVSVTESSGSADSTLLHRKDGKGPAASPNISARGEVLLIANEQVKVRRSGPTEVIRQVDSGKELAWAEGRLIFKNDTVAAVVEQFNRYNHVQLRVIDEVLAARPVSGVFDSSDPESFVAFIQTVADVRVVRGNDRDLTIASVQ